MFKGKEVHQVRKLTIPGAEGKPCCGSGSSPVQWLRKASFPLPSAGLVEVSTNRPSVPGTAASLLPALSVGVLAESGFPLQRHLLHGGVLNCLKGGRVTVKGRLVINWNFK